MCFYLLSVKAKERKEGPTAGKGDAKTREKTSKNEVSVPNTTAAMGPCNVGQQVRMYLSHAQEKKERRAERALAGNEDDIDALLAK
jgi:hypothetical protein